MDYEGYKLVCLWKYKQEYSRLNAICIMNILFKNRKLFFKWK